MSELALTGENFKKEVLDFSGLILVDFWAPWCGPCKMLNPVLSEIEEKHTGKIKIGKLNVDEASAIANKYQVMSIPTLIIFKNGKVLEQIIGMQDKKDLIDRIDDLLK